MKLERTGVGFAEHAVERQRVRIHAAK
jgi:hypothetical protein